MEKQILDFLKANCQTKDDSLEQQRAAQLMILEKQKKLKSFVATVVEELLERDITEAQLIEKANLLSKSCYGDTVTERSIIKICGYPICPNELPPINPKQKYHIDMKNRKIFDVTERKCFCSNLCYKASEFLKEQLADEPLWFRNDHVQDNGQPKVNKQFVLYREITGSRGVQMELKKN